MDVTASGPGAVACGPEWRTCIEGLTAPNLRAVMNGEVAALRMAGFASAVECKRFCAAIHGVDHAVTRAAKTAPMTLLGVNFSNYAGDSKPGYFDQVGRSYALVNDVYARAGFNPLQRMIDRLQAEWRAPVRVAEEPGFGRYFAGGIKTRTHSGNLHYDYTPHTAPGFHIGRVVDQLGWNLYLQMPRDTGHTVLHGRPVPRDGGRIGRGAARALNLDRAFVADAPTYTFRPEVGDVVIINTRFPHDIVVHDPGADELRAQVSSFIGRMDDDQLVLWS